MRLLHNRQTGDLSPYPRQDDEPVAGLDRTAYRVVELVTLPVPEHDPATWRPEAQDTYDWLDQTDPTGLDGILTRGWALVPIEPPPPPPNWAQFRETAINSPMLDQILNQAYASGNPEIMRRAAELIPLYQLAEYNGAAPFGRAWQSLVNLMSIGPEVIAAAVAAAEAAHLPAAFIAALQPPADP
jgi:hypothetical protein